DAVDAHGFLARPSPHLGVVVGQPATDVVGLKSSHAGQRTERGGPDRGIRVVEQEPGAGLVAPMAGEGRRPPAGDGVGYVRRVDSCHLVTVGEHCRYRSASPSGNSGRRPPLSNCWSPPGRSSRPGDTRQPPSVPSPRLPTPPTARSTSTSG